MTGTETHKKFGKLQIFYRAGTSDEDVLCHSFDNDIFMDSIPEYTPAENHTVVDVGAHIGTFSILLSGAVTKGRLFAIEASADTYKYLEKNIQSNSLDRVTPCLLALSDHNGTATLYHDLTTGNWGHSLTAKLSNESEEVQCESLKDFFHRHQILFCDLLKLNCEGAEFRILLSTPVDVLRKISHMLVLYHEDLEANHTLPELQRHLQNAGFLIRFRHMGGLRGWMICLQPTPLNYLKFFRADLARLSRGTLLTIKKSLKRFLPK
jgi:FkbM family methyltransferase